MLTKLPLIMIFVESRAHVRIMLQFLAKGGRRPFDNLMIAYMMGTITYIFCGLVTHKNITFNNIIMFAKGYGGILILT